jgi:hypothetical protein
MPVQIIPKNMTIENNFFKISPLQKAAVSDDNTAIPIFYIGDINKGLKDYG